MLIKTFLKKIFSQYNFFHFINLFLFIVCCVFSIYDIHSHIKNYYKYLVIVNTKLQYNPKFFLPSLTVCIPSVINYDQLKVAFPDIFEKVETNRLKINQTMDEYEWRGKISEHLNIGQLKLLTPDFKKTFESCMFLSNDNRLVDCDRYVPIQHHFSMNHNCYIFFEQNVNEISNKTNQFNFNREEEFDYSLVNQIEAAHRVNDWKYFIDKARHEKYFLYDQKKIKNKDLVRIEINKTILWNGWLDFGISSTGRFYEMYHGQPNFICLSTDVVTKAEFTFSIKEIMRLEEPYSSNCLDYTKLGFRDRSHCVETCYANKTINKMDRWPFFLETNENKLTNIDHIHFAKIYENKHGVNYYTCSEENPRANCKYTEMEIKVNQINFCQENLTVDRSLEDYLLENLTALNSEVDLNDRTTLEAKMDAQMTKDDKKNKILLLRQQKFIEKNSCKMGKFIIVLQFTDEYITELHYEALNQFWDLVSNIGQSISVYLGLCVFDFHKLLGTFFDWFKIYKEGDTKKSAYLRPKKDPLLNTRLGRKLSKQLSARLNVRNTNKANQKMNNENTIDQKALVFKLRDSNNSSTPTWFSKKLDDQDSLPQKIKTFESIQDQFNGLKSHNLQSINPDLVARYNLSKQLNHQLAPINWTHVRGLSNGVNELKNKKKLSNLSNLLKMKSVNPLLMDNKLYGNNGRQVKRVQLQDNPSLIYADDYLSKIINLHKQQNHHPNK